MNHRRESVYVIAEAGVNHNGSLPMALKLIDAAIDAGADAIKFQTFKSEQLATPKAVKADYQSKQTDSSESQLEMLKRLELSEADHEILINYCNEKKIDFLSTPFDLSSLSFLTKYCKVKRLKISSGDLTNGPLLLAAAQSKIPIILSTGMSTLGEVEAALKVLAFGYTERRNPSSFAEIEQAFCSEAGQAALLKNVILLHCTTEYPAPLNNVNLNSMITMKSAFGLPIGYSDHTLGNAVSIAATALGAVVIEKHLTLDKDLAGPDHAASAEPHELKLLINSIRQVEQALGNGRKVPGSSELKNINIARKSVVSSQIIQAGELFNENNLTTKRPASGVSPMLYWDLIGKKALKNYDVNECIEFNG